MENNQNLQPNQSMPTPQPKQSGAKKSFLTGVTKWKKLFIIIGGILALIALFFIFFYKADLEVKVEPGDALVEINNVKYNVGNNKIRPGRWTLKITKPGYETYQKTVVVKYYSNLPLTVGLKEIPRFSKLDQGNVSYLDFNTEKNTLFYLKDQAAYRIDFNLPDPAPDRISPKYFKNVKQFIWAKDNEGAVVQLRNSNRLADTLFEQNKPDGKYSTWYYDFKRYDLLHQQAYLWNNKIGHFDLSPDLKTATYFYSPYTSEKSLVTTLTKKHRSKRIERLSKYDDPIVRWLTNREYILIVDPDRISLYDTFEDQLKEIASDNQFQDAMVTPDSEHILYTTPSSGNEPPLSMMDLQGKEKLNLNIDARISNIIWQDEQTFCSAGEQEDQAILFCYDTSQKPDQALKELSWYSSDSKQFKGLEINSKENILYLIKNNQLLSLKMVYKQY